mgnify:CR=1 FL=1
MPSKDTNGVIRLRGVRHNNLKNLDLDLPKGKLIEQIAAAIAEVGLDRDRPVVASCGSGVTAGVLALVFYLLGKDDVAVYDGSWSEWGCREDTPVET